MFKKDKIITIISEDEKTIFLTKFGLIFHIKHICLSSCSSLLKLYLD